MGVDFHNLEGVQAETVRSVPRQKAVLTLLGVLVIAATFLPAAVIAVSHKRRLGTISSL